MDCPECGDDLPYALAPLSIHRITHPRCHAQFVVSTDSSGDDLEVRMLERNEQWEDAIEDVWPEHQRRVRQTILLDEAMDYAG